MDDLGQSLMRPPVSLDDKYNLDQHHVFMTGTQAVIRMLLMQHARDQKAGRSTAGFISGYRGSPLGALDQHLERNRAALSRAAIQFTPGLNEELAATACWGTQQAEMRGEGLYDGVFALWYGKGPGVDRSGDVFRHANMAGTSPWGGVLALMGDDHTAESSTTAHQSEFTFVDVMMPILNPAGVQEILDFGLYGYAMSRFTGTWTALKGVKDTVESTAVVDGTLDRVSITIPTDFQMPPGGLNIRPRDGILAMEERLQDYKRDAMLAFLRVNPLNKIIFTGGPAPRLGIVTLGKSYLDVRQALEDLGIDEAKANQFGLRLYKIGCAWPLEPEGLKDFVKGLDLVIVVEEKRSLVEVQLREELYGSAHQPLCIGKKDERGDWLFPVKGALDPNHIAIAVGRRLLNFVESDEIRQRVARLEQVQAHLSQVQEVGARIPHFCSGCPHNSSTKVPDGMRAYAGIGCHYMAQWMDRSTEGFTQMGGEGANWVGEAPFSKRSHIFQNLGDGTYNHSGILAIRYAIAAQTTMTYKILFNDAVAMTGGQHHEGGLSVDQIARQVAAEGVKRIMLVSDEPDKYPQTIQWPEGLTRHHRSELDQVQRSLAEQPGVSVLIYDQTCAAEKRRRRKRGLMPDPDQRVFINALVCEGCGDCGIKSNCVSIQPLETEFGRKRQIDQSNCNKDFSCLDGFCPSFVTVQGAEIRKAAPVQAAMDWDAIPLPVLPVLDRTYGLIVTGVGGTGVVTVGAILGMAAHLEGKGCGMIDMAGLAQKGGAVFSHVRLAPRPADIHAIRVSAGKADLVLGCDLVVTGSRHVLAGVQPGSSFIVANSQEVMPGDFTRHPDYHLGAERIKKALRDAAGTDGVVFINASAMAARLLGNTIAANLFLLGYAFQLGKVPLSGASLTQAITLNGEAVAMNLAAFHWGRLAAHDPERVAQLMAADHDQTKLDQDTPDHPLSLDALIAHRHHELTRYQSRAYAQRYSDYVGKVRAAEHKALPGQTALTEAVARALFKVMAIKDEYEVARLYSDGRFKKQLEAQFAQYQSLTYHLAPPLWGKKDAQGQPVKSRFGAKMGWLFHGLAALRFLRATPLDLFGFTQERRMERDLIRRYRSMIDALLPDLDAAHHSCAVEIATLPMGVRGFGHVKIKNLQDMQTKYEALQSQYQALSQSPLTRAQAAE